MATRNSRFQVTFAQDGAGNVVASMERIGQAGEKTGKQLDEAGRSAEEWGRRLGTAVGWLGTAAVAGIGLVIRNSIQAEQELAQLDAVLKSTGQSAQYSRDQLVGMADAIAKASTFSSGEIIEAETRLLSYSGIARENFAGALQIAIDQAARLGMSVTQSAEVVGRALESPTKAAAALAQQGFGASFTANVRESIKALEDAGRTAEAQAMVMDILTEAYGGAAEAMRDTFGGALKSLGKTIMDLLTGEGGMHDAKDAVDALNQSLQDPGIANGIDTITTAVVSLSAELITTIARMAEWLNMTNQLRGLANGGLRPEDASYDALNRRMAELQQQRTATREQRTTIPLTDIEIPSLVAQRQAALTQLDNQIIALQRQITARIKSDSAEEDFDAIYSLDSPVWRGGSPQSPSGANKTTPARTPRRAAAKPSKEQEWAFLEDMRIHADAAAGSLRDYEQAQIDAHNATIDNQAAVDDLIASLMAENDFMRAGVDEQRRMTAVRLAGADATDAQIEAIESLLAQQDRLRESEDVYRDLANITGELFEDVLDYTKRGEDAFGSFVDSIRQMAIRLLADAALRQLGEYLQSLGNSQGGASSGGGGETNWWGTILSAVGNYFAGSGSGGGGRASGGPVSAWSAYPVNETGVPELYTSGGSTWLMTGGRDGMVTPLAAAAARAPAQPQPMDVRVIAVYDRETAQAEALAAMRSDKGQRVFITNFQQTRKAIGT